MSSSLEFRDSNIVSGSERESLRVIKLHESPGQLKKTQITVSLTIITQNRSSKSELIVPHKNIMQFAEHPPRINSTLVLSPGGSIEPVSIKLRSFTPVLSGRTFIYGVSTVSIFYLTITV